MEISLHNYKGSQIEKGFSNPEPEINLSNIEKSLEHNFSKGLITEELFCKAQEELDLIKARGRKVPVGEIRTWNGVKYVKTVSGYERVKEVKTSENKSDKGLTQKQHEQKAYFNLKAFKDLQSSQGEDNNRRDDEMKEFWDSYIEHKTEAAKLAKKNDLKKADSKASLVKEHKRLVDVLESPSHEDDKKEAKIQKKELKEYEEEINKGKEQDKVHKVMKEFKGGDLKSSSGEKVTDRKQAIAIALSEAKK